MVRNGQKHRHRIAVMKKPSASHRYEKLTIAEVLRSAIVSNSAYFNWNFAFTITEMMKMMMTVQTMKAVQCSHIKKLTITRTKIKSVWLELNINQISLVRTE